MLKGFKNFVMRGDIVTVAVGLIIALAFSTLIKAFTDFVVNPVITRLQGGRSMGLGWQLGRPGNRSTYLDLGSFLSAVIYFLIFMAVVYFFIVVPYKHVQARRGQVVFDEPGPLKTCPACLSEDLPEAASKCLHCASEQPPVSPARPA
ncbi:large conductance mechanosensitive channel protein MscL [Streptomyces albireticuli]|uniref:Mechanosensitive ion channel protein MscL n=1 Tax=Streptomyces albireticuli TaxID=1940 RepID=A0A2A2CZ59_9ACTN|nr:MscL family protein [Streptomyces albireticuli]MCD9145802.1 MscL family protein [Streptomyces albireticuli]MCD9165879.1 MscL family protein [Streptomyces albireticuli]MCD9194442.1 MscL family protein [Streptomyces albireticuli]PAU44545.1 mechanosensitive ion channel protein MscL [Streptomyces albireticuli]